MKSHDDVYNKVLEEMAKYEERRKQQRKLLRTRVLPAAIAIILIAAVGLFAMWRSGLVDSPKILPSSKDRRPTGQLTASVPEPSKPQQEHAHIAESDSAEFADVSAYKRIPGTLNGYPVVYTCLISADGKSAYASTMIESTAEDSVVSVSATFYGINRDTNLPVKLEADEIVTYSSEGQSYSIVSCRIPESSNITITRVVSDHAASFDCGQFIQTILRAEANEIQ